MLISGKIALVKWTTKRNTTERFFIYFRGYKKNVFFQDVKKIRLNLIKKEKWEIFYLNIKFIFTLRKRVVITSQELKFKHYSITGSKYYNIKRNMLSILYFIIFLYAQISDESLSRKWNLITHTVFMNSSYFKVKIISKWIMFL